MKTNSTFNIFMQTDLSSSEFKVLALLYQPLVGIEAYSIYSTFYQLSKSKEVYKHSFLFDIFNSTLNDFTISREKLEALGLMETYKVSSTHYLYILKAPFNAKQFLKDSFLGTYLESEIGRPNLNRLIDIFKINKPEVENAQNITKSFDDLYKFNATELLDINADFEGKSNTNGTTIRNGINYDLFVDSLPRALKGSNLLNENFKQRIIQVAFVYQFDVNQMVEIYTQAHKGRKNVTIDQINLQAKLYYEKTNKEVSVSEVIIDANDAISSISYLSIIEKYVIDDVMQKSFALQTVNEFINQNEVDPGVLNVLLMFILKNKNGMLPHVNYLNKVWESWAKNGVQSVTDALSHRDSIEKSWENKQAGNRTYNTKKEVKKPDWLEEYIKEISEMEG